MRMPFLAVLLILESLALSADEVVNFYWAGAGENAATAGGGTWDREVSAVWAEASPTGPLVKWTDHRAAIFQGSSGGTVKIVDRVNAAALKLPATAGPFVFTCGGNIEFDGEGITNDSPNVQALNFDLTMLTFRNGASAGAGAHGSSISIRSDGVIEFTGTATAGLATLVNRGTMNFANQTSAGSAAITNSGIVIFTDESTSAAAALTNQGILNIEGRAHDFARAAFANLTGGVIDVSGAEGDEVALGSVTNAAGGVLVVGTKRLTVATLNLANGNDLNFDCTAAGCGTMRITTSLLGNPKAGATRVAVNNASGLAAGQTYPLLDWTGAASVAGVQLTDFKLQPLPAGFAGTLGISGSRLILTVRASR